MNPNNKVSIITPCYNAAAVIAETIESVLAQTYQNWELLICDDCSTDNSVDVIKTYCEKDSRIKLFSTSQNTGHPIEPRNISLSNALGDVIAFLDADDLWLPTMLAESVVFMMSNNYDIVYSNYEKISWEGKRSNRIIKYKQTATYNDMLKICSVPACITTIIKRESLGDIKFRNVPIEDYTFWLEVFRKGYTAYNTNTVQGLYRQSKNSRSGDKIDMISKHWYILRHVEKVGFLSSLYFMMYYGIIGLKKYLK